MTTLVALCGAVAQGQRGLVWTSHQAAGSDPQAPAGSWWALQGHACISLGGFCFYKSPWAAPKRKSYSELSWIQVSRNSTPVTTPIHSLPRSLWTWDLDEERRWGGGRGGGGGPTVQLPEVGGFRSPQSHKAGRDPSCLLCLAEFGFCKGH